MKKDGSLNWLEKAFVNASDHPFFSIGCGAFTLAAGLSLATIVNHFSERNHEVQQDVRMSDCLLQKSPVPPKL